MTALASEDAWEVNARVRSEFTSGNGTGIHRRNSSGRSVNAVQISDDPTHELSNRAMTSPKSLIIYRNALNQIFRDGIYPQTSAGRSACASRQCHCVRRLCSCGRRRMISLPLRYFYDAFLKTSMTKPSRTAELVTPAHFHQSGPASS
jgi:hypothetical protein